MTRTVADAAAVLTAICGFDEADEAMAGREEAEPIDYTKFLDTELERSTDRRCPNYWPAKGC